MTPDEQKTTPSLDEVSGWAYKKVSRKVDEDEQDAKSDIKTVTYLWLMVVGMIVATVLIIYGNKTLLLMIGAFMMGWGFYDMWNDEEK